jgi:hypothetical protein
MSDLMTGIFGTLWIASWMLAPIFYFGLSPAWGICAAIEGLVCFFFGLLSLGSKKSDENL